jgi:hypothetical protein
MEGWRERRGRYREGAALAELDPPLYQAVYAAAALAALILCAATAAAVLGFRALRMRGKVGFARAAIPRRRRAPSRRAPRRPPRPAAGPAAPTPAPAPIRAPPASARPASASPAPPRAAPRRGPAGLPRGRAPRHAQGSPLRAANVPPQRVRATS